MNLVWLDVHTHLGMLEKSTEDTLRDARAQNVVGVVNIGTGPEDWRDVLSKAEKFFPQVACTLGLHPHDADLWTDEVRTELGRLVSENRSVIGLGEMGLDYHYKHSSKEKQIEAFREQMQMAERLNLPVEIHTREAEDDTLMVLNEFKGRVKGLLHCFTSSWQLGRKALDLGYHLSFSGVVTFQKADELREVCRQTPLDCLHVETDAPFLAPVPHRGRKNHPAWVVETAKVVAQMKGISLEDLSRAAFKNAQDLFPKWPIAVPREGE